MSRTDGGSERETVRETNPASPSEADAPEELVDETEQVEREWLAWVLGLCVVGGGALFLAPWGVVPELAASLGALLAVAAVLGVAAYWLTDGSGWVGG